MRSKLAVLLVAGMLAPVLAWAPPLNPVEVWEGIRSLESVFGEARSVGSIAREAELARTMAGFRYGESSLIGELARIERMRPEVDFSPLVSTTFERSTTLSDHFRVTTTDYLGTRERRVSVPKFEFLGWTRSRAASRLSADLGPARKGEVTLFVGPDVTYPTSEILPGRVSARTFENSPRFLAEHLENVRHLRSTPMMAGRTVVIDLMPTRRPAIEAMDLAGNERDWQGIENTYRATAAEAGVRVERPSKASEVLEMLASGEADIVIVAAHGDAEAIYLPDGSRISSADLQALPKLERSRRPVVVLIACNTGSLGRPDGTAFAQTLLYRGRAVAVVAPTQSIPALEETLGLYRRILKGQDLIEVLEDLGSPWQLYVEEQEPTGRGYAWLVGGSA